MQDTDKKKTPYEEGHPPELARHPCDGLRVLVIEDDFLVAMFQADMLATLGAVVVDSVPSVARAMERIAQPDFEAVTLDINLNGVFSLIVATELQRRQIPYVFCTAYSDPLPGFESTPRVIKPYDADELGVALRQAIGDRA